MSMRLLGTVLPLLLTALVLSLSPLSASAAALTVTTLEDELNNDGDCSLREAITAANTNSAVDACPAGDTGVDTISFNVSGTILLGSTLPAIEDTLIVNGPGAVDLTLSGNNSVGVLVVNTGVSLELHDLTITDSAESGIVNSGSLSVTNSRFTDNSAESGGGINNTGTLSITGSTFSGNTVLFRGGGIYNASTVTVLDSLFISNTSQTNGGAIINDGTLSVTGTTFVNNDAIVGGAIENNGALTINGSSFEDNYAQIDGGGISNRDTTMIANTAFLDNIADEAGGGIQNQGTLTASDSWFHENLALVGGGIANGGGDTVVLTNSTFSGNDAMTGGGIINGGTVTTTNSTFAQNSARVSGAAISTSGRLRLVNSTIARNSISTASAGEAGVIATGGHVELVNTIIAFESPDNCALVSPGSSPTITSLGLNFESGNSCNLTGPGDISNGNIHIASLPTGNGGTNLTLAVLPGSDTIDAGDNDVCAAPPIDNQDQRGMPRPVDGDGDGTAVCDIGAYERQTATSSQPFITIALDAQPDNPQNFQFESGVGWWFQLDDSRDDDGDDISNAMTFEAEILQGTYLVRQHIKSTFVLHDITCDPSMGRGVDLENGLVAISIPDVPDPHVTCTFVNHRRSIVRSVSYKDNSNQDGNLDVGEKPLNQWRIVLYDEQGAFVPIGNNLTNQQGKDGFQGLVAGNYTICQEMKPGWINTQPATIDSLYGEPCYDVTVAPGRIVEVYFGNTDYPLPAMAQSNPSTGVVIRDAPETEEFDTDEAWLNAPLQASGLFIPLVTAED